MHYCKHCKIDHPRNKEFWVFSKENWIKECKLKAKQRNPKYKETKKNSDSKYRLLNKEKLKKNKRNYYLKNRDKILERVKKYRIENKDTIRIKRRGYHSKRKKRDILYRIHFNLSKRLRKALKENKTERTVKYLGCSISFLKQYLESKFVNGMSWDNYGKWEIDHIIPISFAKNKEDYYKLCHYSNLQPLWEIDNIKKGNKLQFWL